MPGSDTLPSTWPQGLPETQNFLAQVLKGPKQKAQAPPRAQSWHLSRAGTHPGTSPPGWEPPEPGSSESDRKPLSGSSSRFFHLFPVVHRLGEPCFISQPSAVYFPNEHKDFQTAGEKAFI